LREIDYALHDRAAVACAAAVLFCAAASHNYEAGVKLQKIFFVGRLLVHPVTAPSGTGRPDSGCELAG
jgi:hypothetical protein